MSPGFPRRAGALVLLGAFCGLPLPVHPRNAARADEFDRLAPAAIARALDDDRAHPRRGEVFPVRALEALPRLVPAANGALVLVRTDRDAVAALLLAPAKRRAPGAPGDGAPVLLVERYVVYESGSRDAKRLARGAQVLLFDGFEFDLDSGVVVPPGHGGDLRFHAEAKPQPKTDDQDQDQDQNQTRNPKPLPVPARVEAAAPGVLVVLPETLPEDPAPAPGQQTLPPLSDGRKVVFSDFAGVYRLRADGRLSGILTLEVSESGVVRGRLLSDANGAVYPVEGQASPVVPQRIDFSVILPRAREEFEGYLFSEGKSAIAGKSVLLDKPAGFYAERAEPRAGSPPRTQPEP